MPKIMCWIGDRKYPSRGARREAVREVLYRIPIGSTVENDDDDALLRDLLDMHPEAEQKIGPGVASFRIGRAKRGKSPGFEVVRTDGTVLDFSYQACLDHPNLRAQVLNAMSAEVEEGKSVYFNARKDDGTLVSDLSGARLATNRTYVGYFPGPSFVKIATDFATVVGGWAEIQLTDSSVPGIARFTDRELAKRWRDYHNEHAVLGLRHPDENPRQFPPSASSEQGG